MFRHKLLAFFDVAWLPLLLLVSTSWLYAPWLHHVHVGHLQVISVYEATGKPFAGIFRAGDILGAFIILLVIWRIKLLHRHRWLGWALILVAMLMVVDDVFVIGCYYRCDMWAILSHRVHDMESMVSLVALAVATAIDAWRPKVLLSRIFLFAQLLAGALIIMTLVNYQGRVFIQYIYQLAAVVWIAYVLRRFAPERPRGISAPYIRSIFAVLVFIGGLFELLLAFHVRDYGRIPEYLLRRGEPVWLAEHSVVAGVLMLYVARYIYKGERRAAMIIAVILGTEIIKYSLLTPSAALLLFGEILAVALWLGWPTFNRNTGVPPLASKLKSLAVLLAGVAASLVLLLLIAASTGQGKDLVQDSRQLFVTSVERLQSTTHENRLQHRLTHLRYISAGLGVSLLAVISWSFFRPAGSGAAVNALTREDAEGILRRHAASSEDYFKLWPDDKLYFTIPGIEGFIAYKKVGATVFALADPVSAPHDRPQLLARFTEFCRGHGWSVCFLLINPGSVGLYEQVGLNVLGIGSSAVVPVQQFIESTLKDKWWRWQTNRAKKAGMQYEVAYPPHNETLLRETAALSQLWLQRAGHTEQGFALGFYDESYLQECILHLLRNGSGELVAFANQLPIYNDLRQTTVDMIRFRPDVNGAMPVLIAHILVGLGEAGQFDAFDLGFVPLAKVENVVAKIARRLAVGRFSAAGLEQFKDKFDPTWQPQFLAYDGDLVDLAALFTRLQKAMKVE